MRLVDESKGFSWGPSIGSNKQKYIYYLWANNLGHDEGSRIASYNFKNNELRIKLASEIDFTKVLIVFFLPCQCPIMRQTLPQSSWMEPYILWKNIIHSFRLFRFKINYLCIESHVFLKICF